MNHEMQSRKIRFIPMCARGEISGDECARLVGISPRSVRRLKRRYREYGDSVFIHGNAGRVSPNKKYDHGKIAADYALFAGTPFASFRDDLSDYLGYKSVPSYTTVRNALSAAGIVSPRARIPVREKRRIFRVPSVRTRATSCR